MKVLIIDDEMNILSDHERLIREVVGEMYPSTELKIDTGSTERAALLMIGQNRYDLIFSDIDMPQMKGIQLSTQIEKLSPHSNLFFVTGYLEYSLEAWNTFACGFYVKPLTESNIRDAFQKLRHPIKGLEEDKVEIKCFGAFEVRYQGEVVAFSRRKSLEMLAVLVDCMGVDTSVGNIRLRLWDESEDTDEKKAYVRQLARDIRSTFSAFGVDGILLNSVGGYRLNRDKIDCDYFQWIKSGEKKRPCIYMSQYEWAQEEREMEEQE